MTLDPAPSDAELLRRLAEKVRRATDSELTALAREVYSAPGPTFRNAPKRGAMNKTEARYAERLDLEKRIGYVVSWKYSPFSIRLAPKTFYRPDFLVQVVEAHGVWVHDEEACYHKQITVEKPSLEIHEVKGHWEDDARAKFKIAAELYPMFVFRAIRRVRGEFHVIETLND